MVNGLFEDGAFEGVEETVGAGVTGTTGAVTVEAFFLGAIMRIRDQLRF